MKIIGVIPARYESTRFEGKPLADICGKPMIWWTYQQVKKAKGIDEVYVATDSKKIEEVCKNNNINVVMTRNDHSMMLERVHEVSQKINGDLYLSLAGDEPLIEPKTIEKLIESYKKEKNDVINLRTRIVNPIDVLNWTTMKVVTNNDDYALYASRSPIPYPKASINYDYYKHMGTYALTKNALDFFTNHKRGKLETVEDFDLLRFLEYGMKVKIVDVDSGTISVDTPKDLDRVRAIIKEREQL